MPTPRGESSPESRPTDPKELSELETSVHAVAENLSRSLLEAVREGGPSGLRLTPEHIKAFQQSARGGSEFANFVRDFTQGKYHGELRGVIEPRKSILEAATSHGMEIFEKAITDEAFPGTPNAEKTERKLAARVFQLEHRHDIREALNAHQLWGLRPATIHELVALSDAAIEKLGEQHEEFTLAALGSEGATTIGQHGFPVLEYVDRKEPRGTMSAASWKRLDLRESRGAHGNRMLYLGINEEQH